MIGGANVKQFIGRIMSRILENELAKKFVWAGLRTNKHAFMKLELKNAINGNEQQFIFLNFRVQCCAWVMFGGGNPQESGSYSVGIWIPGGWVEFDPTRCIQPPSWT